MSKFETQILRWAKKVDVDVKTFTKLTAFKIHDGIVERTPVDTGRARASWTILAGEVADLSVAPEGFSGGSGPAAAGSKARQSSVGLDETYTIANNLPYIERLENGHSSQAPVGMVQLAIADVRTELEIALGT